ncbi:sporulation inhibitor of replication protein SirA [Salibacterium salarium]|uniref:Sporulation inhibitor of replication protein SirA n=2 Tax=Salibacterium salarium TaxID=284579 RepID=A0A3R9P4N6_9BACI|nr:sporulation inhibitor of replication protein SirA [Salibacterium salarium]
MICIKKGKESESMSRYQLTIITKEVALHYYQSEDKLYRLFLDYHKAYDWARPVLEKQIRYVTETFLYNGFIDTIRKDLQSIGFKEELRNGEYFFYSKHSCSKIHMHKRYIIFEHNGSVKEEWEVFDCLKNISPYIFAVNIKKGAFGWLKPLKVFSVL